MKLRILTTMALAIVLLAGVARANTAVSPEKQKLIAELLEIQGIKEMAPKMVDSIMTQMEGQFRQGMVQGLQSAQRLNPNRQQDIEQEINTAYDDFSKKFRERFAKEIDIGKVTEDITASLYDKYYTEAELKDLIAFYRTATGRKTLRIMPQLMAESMQRSSEILNPKIFKMIGEIMEQEKQKLLDSEKPAASKP
jgi:hypothetical protein